MALWRALLNLLVLRHATRRLNKNLIGTTLVYLAAGAALIVLWHGIKRAPQKMEFKARQSETVTSRKG